MKPVDVFLVRPFIFYVIGIFCIVYYAVLPAFYVVYVCHFLNVLSLYSIYLGQVFPLKEI